MPQKNTRRAPARSQPTKTTAVKATESLSYEARRIKRHLESLEKSNYSGDAQTGFADAAAEEDARAEGSLALATLKKRKSKADQSVAVRTLLMYRKHLPLLIEESGLVKLSQKTPSYLTAAAPPPRAPPLRLCSVCGYKGIHKCVRCGMEYCDLTCKLTHDETRCERRSA